MLNVECRVNLMKRAPESEEEGKETWGKNLFFLAPDAWESRWKKKGWRKRKNWMKKNDRRRERERRIVKREEGRGKTGQHAYEERKERKTERETGNSRQGTDVKLERPLETGVLCECVCTCPSLGINGWDLQKKERNKEGLRRSPHSFPSQDEGRVRT